MRLIDIFLFEASTPTHNWVWYVESNNKNVKIRLQKKLGSRKNEL